MPSEDAFILPDPAQNTASDKPDDLTKIASFLLDIEAIKSEYLDDALQNIKDLSWDILLHLYTASGIKKEITIPSLATAFSTSQKVVTRYVNFLSDLGMVDKPETSSSTNNNPLILSDQAHDVLTEALQKCSVTLNESDVLHTA